MFPIHGRQFSCKFDKNINSWISIDSEAIIIIISLSYLLLVGRINRIGVDVSDDTGKLSQNPDKWRWWASTNQNILDSCCNVD
jgi:hypothetical protein